MDDVRLDHLDGETTRGRLHEIRKVYAAAFPHYDLDDYERRILRQSQTSGFEAVVAHLDSMLAGFVYGLPLQPGTSWWEGLDPAQPDEFRSETGRRTFAVIDFAVLPSLHGRGLGRRLMGELLGSRSEERATLATSPDAQALDEMYQRWGWSKVGQVPGGEGETQPVYGLYVMALR